MMSYTVREYPNINDPDLIHCCATAQQMRSTLLDFFRHIVSQLDRIPVTIPTRVALAVLSRMAEGSLSIEILSMKSRVRDAAILLLSLFELRWDLQYIALDAARAETWIDHARQNSKPWNVAAQLREIYTNPRELDAQSALYRQYSMVKHCNRSAKFSAFQWLLPATQFNLISAIIIVPGSGYICLASAVAFMMLARLHLASGPCKDWMWLHLRRT